MQTIANLLKDAPNVQPIGHHAPKTGSGVCKICEGIGYYIFDVNQNDPRFGRSVRCECNPKKFANRMPKGFEDYGLSPRELKYEIEYAPTVERFPRAVNVAKSICDRGGGIATFYGDYGTGKSGIMIAVVVDAIRRGRTAYYTTAPDLLSRIRATYNKSAELTEERIIEFYANVDVLAIDELHMAKITEYVTQTLMTILDKRYRNRDRLITMFATNLYATSGMGGIRMFSQLDETFAYLDNRLLDGFLVEMSGASLRGSAR